MPDLMLETSPFNGRFPTSIFVAAAGSEGTLAFITENQLMVLPCPPSRSGSALRVIHSIRRIPAGQSHRPAIWPEKKNKNQRHRADRP